MSTDSLSDRSSQVRVLRGVWRTGLWLWVAFVFAVYLWQFRDTFEKIYRLMVGI
jgi:hypothetical protein